METTLNLSTVLYRRPAAPARKQGGLGTLFRPVDLIHGSCWRAILAFACPIILSYLLQQIYTIIDNMPAVCMDAAVGVRLADILKTAGIDLNSIQLLNFYCADVANTWYTSYSKTALLDTPHRPLRKPQRSGPRPEAAGSPAAVPYLLSSICFTSSIHSRCAESR